MIGLVDLLDKHGEAIEADLRRHYGVRVRDLFAVDSDLTPREVMSYLIHAPEDSAYHAELRGGQQFRGWTSDRYLLASILDVLQGANYQRSGGKGKKPKPTWRPKKSSAGTSLSSLVPRGLRRSPRM